MKTKDKSNSATKKKKAKAVKTSAKNEKEQKFVLEPCPFCGATPSHGYDKDMETWFVFCPKCHAQSGGSANKQFVTDLWNCRFY